MRPLKIMGSGQVVPANRLTSEALDARHGLTSGWFYQNSGVATRYVCGAETQVDMAVDAASQAIGEAGISPDEIGLIVFAAAVAYQSIPATAPLIQARLGIKDGTCMAFDVNSTCLSFLTALDVAGRMAGGRKALVVASEVASRGLPWEDDPATAALFGDGAAAVIISCEDAETGIVASRMETYPKAYEACQLASGGTRFDYHEDRGNFDRNSRFRMDGDVLFRLTLRHFRPFLDRLLADADWRRDEVDLVVPHQASPGALAHLVKKCGFDGAKVVNVVRDYGNQIAASIPTALHIALKSGVKGRKTLLLGTSAGVSFGGMALIL